MREGHRHDILDDVLNDSNYRKTVNLGELIPSSIATSTQCSLMGLSLSQKLVTAKRECELHKMEFELFSQSIPSSTRDGWLAMVTLWESDSAKPNPYVVTAECTLTFSKFCLLVLMHVWS